MLRRQPLNKMYTLYICVSLLKCEICYPFKKKVQIETETENTEELL